MSGCVPGLDFGLLTRIALAFVFRSLCATLCDPRLGPATERGALARNHAQGSPGVRVWRPMYVCTISLPGASERRRAMRALHTTSCGHMPVQRLASAQRNDRANPIYHHGESSNKSPKALLTTSIGMFIALAAALLASAGVIGSPVCAVTLSVANVTARATSAANALFPISPQLKTWTTDPDLSNPSPLSDSTFRPHNQITALTHPYVNAPDGRLSMKAHYPAGSYTFSHTPQGGFSFYAPGPESVDLTTAKEATFGYSVYFPAGFDFVKGGKLPGLYGGDSDSEAVSCSGGRRDDGCFSARIMWRTNGAGELYTYLPPDFDANQAVCDIPPFSTCNSVYGASVGRGSFTWKTGGRTTISQRVRLNDAGQENGELELFVGGESVVSVGGLVLRDSDAGRIRGIQMQTFFGGSDSSWASPVDQDVYFSDFSVAITETL